MLMFIKNLHQKIVKKLCTTSFCKLRNPECRCIHAKSDSLFHGNIGHQKPCKTCIDPLLTENVHQIIHHTKQERSSTTN